MPTSRHAKGYCHHQCPPCPPSATKYELDHLRLEAVTVCVGFDDFLDYQISHNHAHLDTLIVVTSHDDKKTQLCCQKHGVICVETDLVKKNGRKFNKGAAINAGFNRFQWNGWRMHLDADILLPDNFRRQVFNHCCLEKEVIYGADRVDVVGEKDIRAVRNHRQHNYGYLIYTTGGEKMSARYVDGLNGYVPIGFFQMWHASQQRMYPWSLGTAAHDDVSFAIQWPECQRRILPNVVVRHMITEKSHKFAANWEGRTEARLK